MKLLSRPAVLLLSAVLVLGGCANHSKKFSGPSGGSTDMAGLPGQGGDDTLNPNGLAANARPDGVNPDTDVDYSVLSAETIYFDFDSNTIRSSERGKLQKIADWLKENPGKRLMLAGHTDIRGTPEYNRGLGERRGLAVREYLVGLGIEASRLFTISYGSERPAVQGSDEAAYAKNRRVAPGVITK
ncbi:MAG: OmpA family protein [Verrucomicrobium sp.]|nr:OmpA family protein [Verrucomicrobium sp.]